MGGDHSSGADRGTTLRQTTPIIGKFVCTDLPECVLGWFVRLKFCRIAADTVYTFSAGHSQDVSSQEGNSDSSVDY